MVLGQFFCVPFVQGLIAKRYSYYWVGVAIQHTYQTFYLGIAIWWGFHRQWYWVQAGFLVLRESLSSVSPKTVRLIRRLSVQLDEGQYFSSRPMRQHWAKLTWKMHSYMAHNGMLSKVFFRLQEEKKTLDKVLEHAPGGRNAILEEATARRAQYAEGAGTPVGTPGIGNTPLGTPALSTAGRTSPPNVTFATTDGSTSYEKPAAAGTNGSLASGTAVADAYGYRRGSDPDTGNRDSNGNGNEGLRRRSIVKNAANGKKQGTGMPQPDADLPHGTSLEPSHNTMPHEPREPNVLSYSPDEKIAVLARNIDMMEDELRSNGAKGLVWPHNVTYRNYFDYVFFPTLVYQLEYPRTET